MAGCNVLLSYTDVKEITRNISSQVENGAPRQKGAFQFRGKDVRK
jgi:hypothetical protein